MTPINNPYSDSDLSLPTTPSKYLNFKEYKTYKFRILSREIQGWQYFDNTTNKPVRFRKTEEGQKKAMEGASKQPVNSEYGQPTAKFFWAMPVWNYETKQIEVLVLDKKDVLKSIIGYIQDEDWGNPIQNYDISITKVKEGTKTVYRTQPIPPKPLAKEIKEAFENTHINLNALYYAKDCFDETFEEPEDILTVEDCPF